MNAMFKCISITIYFISRKRALRIDTYKHMITSEHMCVQISAKEPYVSKKEPYFSQKSPTY